MVELVTFSWTLEYSSHIARSSRCETEVADEVQYSPTCNKIGRMGVVLDIADRLARRRVLSGRSMGIRLTGELNSIIFVADERVMVVYLGSGLGRRDGGWMCKRRMLR